MITVIAAEKRFYMDRDWLQTHWLFSFDEYYDPANIHFSALRVFNDDVVQPGHGFPLHPHREMEIVTIPFTGEITHADSAGHRAVCHAGEVQRMTAGTGVEHSEYNEGTDALHLYQIWFLPHTPGLPPGYEQRAVDPACWHNRLCPLASGQGAAGAVHIHTDATLYRARLDAGVTLDYPVRNGRHIFIYLANGQLQVNDSLLHDNDQARISEETALTLRAEATTEFVLIDLP